MYIDKAGEYMTAAGVYPALRCRKVRICVSRLRKDIYYPSLSLRLAEKQRALKKRA